MNQSKWQRLQDEYRQTKWRLKYGNRKADQKGDDSAQSDAAARTLEAVAASILAAYQTRKGARVNIPGLMTWPSASVAGTVECSIDATSLVYPLQCSSCGAWYLPDGDTKHVCEELSQIDMDTVMTIQRLAASGLTPEEIAGDLDVRFGYRLWSVNPYGLRATSTNIQWFMDKPIRAVCADNNCCGMKSKCERAPSRSGAPFCRIHAVKDNKLVQYYMKDGRFVGGMVALWGEVIECEQGWLATRAYPLGFYEPFWARVYRVPVIVEGK